MKFFFSTGSLAEWFKAPDLGYFELKHSGIFGCVGSNPIALIFCPLNWEVNYYDQCNRQQNQAIRRSRSCDATILYLFNFSLRNKVLFSFLFKIIVKQFLARNLYICHQFLV